MSVSSRKMFHLEVSKKINKENPTKFTVVVLIFLKRPSVIVSKLSVSSTATKAFVKLSATPIIESIKGPSTFKDVVFKRNCMVS